MPPCGVSQSVKILKIFVSLQVQLQNILMSKYVEYFQAEVSGWQRKLMVADLVISSWMSVQRTWAHLNSIFTNSQDIRCQLANDAERFQGIHADFQVTAPAHTHPSLLVIVYIYTTGF